MYSGTANDCTFKNNVAGTSGNDTYNTNVRQPVLTVSDFESSYNSGSKLAISFVTGSGKQITDANVTIRVYRNNALAGIYYCLSGTGWAVALDAGNYTAAVSIENQGYEVDPVNATLTITQASSKISASDVSAVYNVNKDLIVTLKDGNNNVISGVKVTIKLSNGKTVTPTTDNKGQVKLSISGLAPKAYSAAITFAGNANYAKSSASAKVTVKKATPKLTVKAKTFKKSAKTKKYDITLKTNQNKAMKNAKVTITVNKKTYTAKTNSKGKATFKITKLNKKGKFTATVKFAKNTYYNAVSKKVKITVK
jgi:hypothetical protein